jgi:aspartyl-tRNA(Asn)/glutamyl-tRNA(Gln) amidotransferase subunit A
MDLSGARVIVSPDLGSAKISDAVRTLIVKTAEEIIKIAGLQRVDVDIDLPPIDWEWAIANQAGLYKELGDRWPDCEDLMTKSMAFGVRMGLQRYNLDIAARVEEGRTAANERMATIFDQTDFVICAANPDIAFPAHVESNTRVAGGKAPPGNNGALTIPANISGNPAISIPAGLVDGAPVGIQIMAVPHQDRAVLDLAHMWECHNPWPLTAPQ